MQEAFYHFVGNMNLIFNAVVTVPLEVIDKFPESSQVKFLELLDFVDDVHTLLEEEVESYVFLEAHTPQLVLLELHKMILIFLDLVEWHIVDQQTLGEVQG